MSISTWHATCESILAQRLWQRRYEFILPSTGACFLSSNHARGTSSRPLFPVHYIICASLFLFCFCFRSSSSPQHQLISAIVLRAQSHPRTYLMLRVVFTCMEHEQSWNWKLKDVQCTLEKETIETRSNQNCRTGFHWSEVESWECSGETDYILSNWTKEEITRNLSIMISTQPEPRSDSKPRRDLPTARSSERSSLSLSKKKRKKMKEWI